MDLSLVIPCYNEGDHLEDRAETIISYMASTHPHLVYEVIFVNDGSTDSTQKVIESLQSKYSFVRNVSYFPNQGRGFALSSGFKATSGKKVISLDADLSYDVGHITDVLKEFEADEKVEVVVVSAYMRGGYSKNVPLKRLLLSRFANWILSGFFYGRISTVTCMVRGYDGELVRRFTFVEKGKEIHLEILRKLALLNANIKEIPGRLVWKKADKPVARRKTNLIFSRAIKNHLLYGLMIRPNRFLKWSALIILAIGIWESFNVLGSIFRFYRVTDKGFSADIWMALNSALEYSPHTFIIAGVSTIVGFQIFFFVVMIQVNKLQQEELLKHILALQNSLDAIPKMKTSDR